MIKGIRKIVYYKDGNPEMIIYGRMIVYRNNREPPIFNADSLDYRKGEVYE